MVEEMQLRLCPWWQKFCLGLWWKRIKWHCLDKNLYLRLKWSRVRIKASSITCSSCWWLGTRALARAVSSSASLPIHSKTCLLPSVCISFLSLRSTFPLNFVRISATCNLFVFGFHFLCVGVDFKVKYVNLGGKKLKLAIWDTGKSVFYWSCLKMYSCGACSCMITSFGVFLCDKFQIFQQCCTRKLLK